MIGRRGPASRARPSRHLQAGCPRRGVSDRQVSGTPQKDPGARLKRACQQRASACGAQGRRAARDPDPGPGRMGLPCPGVPAWLRNDRRSRRTMDGPAEVVPSGRPKALGDPSAPGERPEPRSQGPVTGCWAGPRGDGPWPGAEKATRGGVGGKVPSTFRPGAKRGAPDPRGRLGTPRLQRMVPARPLHRLCDPERCNVPSPGAGAARAGRPGGTSGRRGAEQFAGLWCAAAGARRFRQPVRGDGPGGAVHASARPAHPSCAPPEA